MASKHSVMKRGLFVPSGLHLIEGKEVVSNIMKAHEEYTQLSAGLPIAGLTHKEMTQEKIKDKAVKEIIMNINGVESVEKCQDTNYMGQWLIVTNKRSEKAEEKEIETNLAKLYQTQTGQSRIILASTNRINRESTTKKVATYTEIRSKRYARKSLENKSCNTTDEEAQLHPVEHNAQPLKQNDESRSTIHAIEKKSYLQ